MGFSGLRDAQQGQLTPVISLLFWGNLSRVSREAVDL